MLDEAICCFRIGGCFYGQSGPGDFRLCHDEKRFSYELVLNLRSTIEILLNLLVELTRNPFVFFFYVTFSLYLATYMVFISLI